MRECGGGAADGTSARMGLAHDEDEATCKCSRSSLSLIK